MEENTQVGWNLAQHIIQELAQRLAGANEAYISSNYPRAFNNLRAVRMRVSPSLEATEHKSLVTKENEFAVQYALSVAKGFGQTKEQGQAVHKMFKLYGEYNDLLMASLKKYGYLIPPKEDKTNLNK